MAANTDSTQDPVNGSVSADKSLPVDTLAPTDTGASSRAPSPHSVQTSVQSTVDTPASSMNATPTATEKEEEEWKAPTDGQPFKSIIPRPSPKCKPLPPAVLTAEQETKYATVLAAVKGWKTLPSSTVRNAAQAEITDHERMWLTRECLLRYLRATKWRTADALKRLQHTLSWRREYGADTFTADYISPENETGKQMQLGFDNDCRPCLYLEPGKQNTKVSDRQVHHLSYMLDRTIDLMPPGVENNALLINFKGAASSNVPSLKQTQAVLNILQTHNPERLGKALISETPWYVNTFFKVISPFIDPVTKDKMKFQEDLRKYVPAEQLWDRAGGDLRFEYDHAVYWPAFTAECQRRREAMRQRWEAAGKQIGESEVYLRGGDHPSLRQQEEQAEMKKNQNVESAGKTETAKDAEAPVAGVANLSVQ